MNACHYYSFLPFFLGTGLGWAQQDFDKVEIKTMAVAGNVHMLEGAGGNIAVSTGPDGVLMVDDQYAPMAGKIAAAISKLDGGPLKFVLNTHWHADHTGGNAHFGKSSTLIAQTNVRKRLAGRSGAAKESLPIVTYDESASVHFNGEEIRLVYYGPGHTDGDTVIYFTGSGVVHTGDLFVNARFPFIDLGSGGNLAGLMKTVEQLLKSLPDDVKIIPGHGALATKQDLKSYHDMLVETTDLVKQAIQQGKSLADLKAAGLPEKYKSWGTGFINTSRWLEIAYNSLAAK
jgi:cyclase